MAEVSALAKQVDLSLHAGSSAMFPIRIIGSDDEPIWMDTWSSKCFVFRQQNNGLSVKFVLSSDDGDIKHYPATLDVVATAQINDIHVYFPAAKTRELGGVYEYEIKGYQSGDLDGKILIRGLLTIVPTADRGGNECD